MTDETLLALLCGAVVGGGILLLIIAIRGTEPRDETPSFFRRNNVDGRKQLIRIGSGIAVGLIVLVVTKWLVLAAALGLLAGMADRFFGGTGEERRAIDRLEALATWTEALRDTIAGAVGLEQAIPATAVNAAPAIKPGLNLLVDRLRIREPLPSALMRFADDLDDPSADLIVAALVLNARLRGPGLREVLSALADSAREELDVRRKVAAERRSTRRSVQVVVAITLLVAAALVLFNPQYVAPYTSFIGQFVLFIVIALYALGLIWLRKLAKIEVPERFLIGGNDKRAGRSEERMEVVGG
ncbi:type II secretion system protein [Kribbella sandramycini]|uniref:Flp pilus assembly protein TadB n=1 Tax=Kribbella sandramycini TaxID=60450 RepID=A0A7Y4KYL9_9ACTN|nr:type II secretion system F family protein [Kribbella sandramycini]MBB6569086.1 Flp pilus assembly protein TadB [Kribbella sandramycini]NOL41070.1 type II secretion system protein [Kribbella sandramycini]